MMEIGENDKLYRTGLGCFSVKCGKITPCGKDYVFYDKYGNSVDNKNRIYTNAAGEVRKFYDEVTQGVLLNNGMIASNGEFGAFEERVCIVNLSNFRVSFTEGHINIRSCLFYDEMHNIIDPVVELGMKYFSTQSYEKRTIKISTFPEESTIEYLGAEHKFMITKYMGAEIDRPILFNVSSATEFLSIYLFETFIISNEPINMTNAFELLCINTCADYYIYEIKSSGKHTKAAAHNTD